MSFSGEICQSLPPQPLILCGIDPGVTTGLAAVSHHDGETNLLDSITTDDPQRVVAFLTSLYPAPSVIAIEDFIGSGRRSTYSKQTIKVIGWVENFAKWNGWTVKLQVPQVRYRWLKRAETLLRAAGHTKLQHKKDALAHCFAWLYLYKG